MIQPASSHFASSDRRFVTANELATDFAIRITQPVLETRKASRERGDVLRQVAAQVHPYPGGRRVFKYDTLRCWVMTYEKEGPAALMLVLRRDRGKRRVLVTREWDQGIDLPADVRESVVARVVRTARSMIANDGTSVKETLRLSAFQLQREAAEIKRLFNAVDSGFRLFYHGLSALMQVLETRDSAEPDIRREPDIRKTLHMMMDPARNSVALVDRLRELLGRGVFGKTKTKPGGMH
jgi:hypothetical protein